MKNTIVIALFASLTLISCDKNKEVILINAGIGGNNTYDLLDRIETDVLYQQPDMVILMIGTNDMLKSDKMISYWEYEENLDYIVKILQHEKINVILCSPPTVDTVDVFEKRGRIYDENPNKKLENITRIMKRIAMKEGVHFVDINDKFRQMNIPIHNQDDYIVNEKNSNRKDGVHPTAKGYDLIAETILLYMRQHNLLYQKAKIICFGDSITFGVDVEGAGTVSGETYPAFLKRKLLNLFTGN